VPRWFFRSGGKPTDAAVVELREAMRGDIEPIGDESREELLRALLEPQVSAAALAYEARLVQRVARRTARSAFAQRVFDVVVGSFALVVASPFLAACALAVRLTSRGPVIFHQTRIGVRGRPFQCLKFRTMCVDAEERLNAILLQDEAARSSFEALFKLERDPRITRVGRFLRASSLDELPQLINVLRGEMSLVGPRPVVPQELSRYGAFAQVILQVRPGMTGAWQVERDGETTYAERIKLDLEYVMNRTVRSDAAILSKTVVRLRTAGGHTSR
jgi:lipopolysaccharide/colanic/teichoic acid biosynthesis glycosyltransferase